MSFLTSSIFKEETSDLKGKETRERKNQLPRQAVLQERIWVCSESQLSQNAAPSSRNLVLGSIQRSVVCKL